MIRKQIFLTPELERQIALTAVAERKPQAQVVREALTARFSRPRPVDREGGLLGLARLGEELGVKGPPDLSRNIDKYLYEDP